MKKKLFLAGPAGCGKSELLLDVLGPALAMAGGFATVPEKDAGGNMRKVVLLPAAALGGVDGFDAKVFLDYSSGRPQKDNEVLREYGTRYLEEALYYNFAVLDCIGGIDLMIPQYRAALETLLNSDLPIAGALLSPEAAAKRKAEFSISDRFDTLTANLPQQLSGNADTLVLNVETMGRDAAKRILEAWAKEYVFS